MVSSHFFHGTHFQCPTFAYSSQLDRFHFQSPFYFYAWNRLHTGSYAQNCRYALKIMFSSAVFLYVMESLPYVLGPAIPGNAILIIVITDIHFLSRYCICNRIRLRLGIALKYKHHQFPYFDIWKRRKEYHEVYNKYFYRNSCLKRIPINIDIDICERKSGDFCLSTCQRYKFLASAFAV